MKAPQRNRALLCLFIVALMLLTSVQCLVAQTGPAGVGNASSNKVWLDASYLTGLSNGALVASWSDRSGNAWNALQNSSSARPSYLVNQLNGQPVIRFNRGASGKWLDITSTGIGAVMSNSSTLFVVAKANSGGANSDKGQWQSIFGAVDSYSGILFQGYPTTTHFYIDSWVPSTDLIVTAPITQGSWYGATRLIKESSAGLSVSGFVNGVGAGTATNAQQSINHNNLVRLGACLPGTTHGYLLDGDIAEIILFNTSVSISQRIIVENYLSSKYNLTITNDYFAGHSAEFIKDVQGIGTVDGLSDKHILASNSKGLILTEANSTLNSPNEFLFCGHASASNSFVSNELQPGVESRWQRNWFIAKTGNVDAKLSFDFSQAALVPPTNLNEEYPNYRLLFRAAVNGNFSVVMNGNEELVPTLENGDQLSFNVTDLQLITGYYTVGYSPNITWNGAIDNNWNVSGNWNLNRTPLSLDHVIVNACTTCPSLSGDVSVAGLRLNDHSGLNLSSSTLTVSGKTYINGSNVSSASGSLSSGDFSEIKNSTVIGPIRLVKTGGIQNACYGGNLFSPELQIVNSSTNDWLLAHGTSNIVK